MPLIGIVCGMAAEASIVRRSVPTLAASVRVAGASEARAERLAQDLAARGARGLVSFGICGALAPHLSSGILVLATEVVSEDGGECYPTNALMREALRQTALKTRLVVTEERLLGTDRMILSATEKASLFEKTQAAAIDMESRAVARVAQRAGLPFAVMRAVADPANRAVPRAAQAGLGPTGRNRPLAVLAALAKDPRDLPGLLAIAGDTNKAMGTLRRGARRLLPALMRLM
jgi:adenosylhomocysteine nucleosidase